MKRLRHIAIICFAILCLNLISVSTVHAVELSLSDLNLVGCDEADPESAQPERYRSGCYILNGQISNNGENTIENVDVFENVDSLSFCSCRTSSATFVNSYFFIPGMVAVNRFQ